MIVVAIIGILAAIAIPSYQNYTKKAKFTEVVEATHPFKVAVEGCFQTTGDLSVCSAGSNGIPQALGAQGRVLSLDAAAGKITAASATGSTDVDKNTSYTYILNPTQGSNGLIWDDSSSSCKGVNLC